MRTRDTDKELLVRKRAISMLVNDGLDGFSMNKLAKACGISVATLYIYFQDKDDLIQQIGLDISRNFVASTFDGFSPDMPFAEGLRKQWENRARFAMAFPDEVAYHDMIRHTHYGDYILDEVVTTFKNVMATFIQNAITNHELKPVAPEVFWSVAYGPLYTLLRFHRERQGLGGKPFQLSDDLLEDALQMVLNGLKP
ncbi:TetR/AcrR family transcriptional regulator [Fibrella forsythiae]|uniref:TetR/AcrR family transcriptional regulator n=1 Tax=Fibrella forsythiae TaxID=2817061 RepID=A0ABS3JDP6_9BACT|nr:TetR/AcrR family transcriptional regulator [Fibrella forsythiae]MBO0948117.1 TetR/AcrR family transcriptional regulator [Fibrella forsythiae]